MENTSIWKANLNSGLLSGLITVAFTLVIYFLDLTFNLYQGYIALLIQIVILLIFMKAFRNNFNHGFISYGKALTSGIIISLLTAIIYAIFIYFLYSMIDKDLVNRQLAQIEEIYHKKNLPQTSIDAALKIQAKFLQPTFYAITRLFSKLLMGIILSLFIAIFIKKEGNPILENENGN
jgi:hypothetical protein